MMITRFKNPEAEVGNKVIPQLEALGVGPEVQRFFLNSFSTDHAGRIVFDYYYGKELKDKEVFGFQTHKLSCSKGFWIAGDMLHPKDVFLFFSAIEAIAFAHLNKSKFNFSSNCLFISLGVRPSKYQIDLIKRKSKKLRFHTVFTNDILGRIYDCKTSIWLANKDCSFYLKDDLIQIQEISLNDENKFVEIDRSKFSYFSFCRQFGKRSNLKTHKAPKKEHISFFDYLACKNQF